MTIIDIIFIAMIGLGITLTIVVLRQRKANKYLSELSGATRVITDGEYSSIGVAIRSGEKLLKCPECAEYINVEAKICKDCQSDVSSFTSQKGIELQELTNKINAEKTKSSVARKKSTVTIIIGVFSSILLFTVISTLGDKISERNAKNDLDEKLSRIDQEYRNWKEIAAVCNFTNGIQKNDTDFEDSLSPVSEVGTSQRILRADIQEFWNTDAGTKWDCFSQELIGLKLSTYFAIPEGDPENFSSIYLFDEIFTDGPVIGAAGTNKDGYQGYVFGTDYGDDGYLMILEWNLDASR
jgi:hypothetical protein